MARHREQHPGRVNRRGRNGGFALVMVIFICALLSLAVLSFAQSMRTHVRIAANAVANAQAESLADGGVELAIADVLRRMRRGDRAVLDGAPFSCSMPGGDVLTLEVRDEAGRVDINAAREPILTALLTGLGTEPDRARRLADAIIDFRDADSELRPFGAEAEQYRASGRPGEPKNAAFDVVEELGSVLGMTRPDWDRLQPFVTVRSGQEGVDPKAARTELAALLRLGQEGASLAGQATGGDSIPRDFVVASARQAFSIRSTIRTLSGVTFAREAVVRLLPQRPSRPAVEPGADPDASVRARAPAPNSGGRRDATLLIPQIFDWRRGTVPVISVRVEIGALTPC